MKPFFASAALVLIAGCSNPADTAAAIQLAAGALPCYEAISAATKASAAPKVLTGASVAALHPACVAVDQASLTLIASAINAKAKVVSAAVSAPAVVKP